MQVDTITNNQKNYLG